MANYLFDRKLYFNVRKRERFYFIFDTWFRDQFKGKNMQKLSNVIDNIESNLLELNSLKIRRGVFCNFQIAFLMSKVQSEVISAQTRKRVKLAYIEELKKYELYYDLITNLLQDLFGIGLNKVHSTAEFKQMNIDWGELVFQLNEFQKEIELHKTGNSQMISSPNSPDYFHTAYLIFAHDHEKYHWGTPPTQIDGRNFRARIYTEKAFVENVHLLVKRDFTDINISIQRLTEIAQAMGIIDQDWNAIKTNFYGWAARVESKSLSLNKICAEMKSILKTQKKKERFLRKNLGDKLIITSPDAPFYNSMLLEYAFWLFANWEGFTDIHIETLEPLPVEFPS